MDDNQPQDGGLPRENLIRATFPANLELRSETEDGSLGTMDVQFTRYNEWTEINSSFEGNFMERFAPKSLSKTIKENLKNLRVLFQHGRDPQVGDKVLGPIKSIKDSETGARAQVPLYDTSYNRDLLPGLKDGAYGASVRFTAVREEFVREPGKSEYNPKGLPERTITEAKVMELGPVTFPAYEGTTAGVRSLTLDDLTPEKTQIDINVELDGKTLYENLSRSPLTTQDTPEALKPEPDTTEPEATIEETQEAAPPHPPDIPVRRDTQPEPETSGLEETVAREYRGIEDIDARLGEIKSEQNEIYSEFGVRSFDADTQARWDEMKEEKAELDKMKADFLERKAYIDAQIKENKQGLERGAASPGVVANRSKAPEDVFDLPAYHDRASSQEHLSRLYKEGAERALDGMSFPDPNVDQAKAAANTKEMLDREDPHNEMAQRLLIHGSPTYRSAFWKTMSKQPLNADEQRKMQEGMQLERALTAAADGGITVPVQIDPTVLLTSSGALNPFRQISRLVRTTSFQWQGVTSAGVTAAYALEGAAMIDNTPTLVAPTITPERANVFVPYTWEAAQDWASLEGEMASLFADSKDILEATQFAVGAGHASNVPQGVLVGAGTLIGGATSTVGTTDLFRWSDALPVRFQPRASWVASPSFFSKIRQVAGGANTGIWAENLQVGNPPMLLGYPAYKASSVGTAWDGLGGGPKAAIIGDFSFYAIVERIGFQVRNVDTIFNGNTAGGIAYPNGMGGLIGYWRNSAGVLASNAFRTGTVT